jgi:hypothetical protein
MKVYSYYDFQVCLIQEDDGPIYKTRVGDNQIYSLMDIHSIINIIHNKNKSLLFIHISTSQSQLTVTE